MTVLVAYSSRTGNTRKVAEAIYDELVCNKEIKKIDEVTSLDGYYFAFLGFPVEMAGPDKKAAATIAALTPGRRVALFATHFAPEDAPEAVDYMARFREAAPEAQVVGTFNCRGKVSRLVRLIMSVSPDPEMRLHAKDRTDKGQPDASALDRAREFARWVMRQVMPER